MRIAFSILMTALTSLRAAFIPAVSCGEIATGVAMVGSKKADFIALLHRALVLEPTMSVAEVIIGSCESLWPGWELQKLRDDDLCYALRQFIFVRRPRDCMEIPTGEV